MLAQEFAGKAKVNAEFVLAALKGMGRDVLGGVGVLPALGLQPANQLIAEGIELALKALLLARGSTPPAHHRLRCLYALLDDADRSFVDEAVRHAVDESATGSVPFGLPNVASAAVRGGAPLGEGDPSSGYAEMDAAAFFALLDATWGAGEQPIPRSRPEIRRRKGGAHQYEGPGRRHLGLPGARRAHMQQHSA